MKRLLLAIVSLLIAAGCYSSSNVSPAPIIEPVIEPVIEPEPKIPPHFVTYTDEIGLFSISYPLGWKLFPNETERYQKSFYEYYNSDVDYPDFHLTRQGFWIFYAEAPRDAQARFHMSVFVQPASELDMSLDQMVEVRLQNPGVGNRKLREFSRVNTVIDERDAIIVDSEWEMLPEDYGTLRILEMFTFAHQLLWEASCTVDSQEFKYCQDDLYAILRSLRVLK